MGRYLRMKCARISTQTQHGGHKMPYNLVNHAVQAEYEDIVPGVMARVGVGA